MVSILPQKLSPFQAIGKAMSELGRNTPQLLENRFQTERGLSAIDQLQDTLGQAGGDINKILPALARAYTLNPNLERSGLGQQCLQQARVGNLFGAPHQNQAPAQSQASPMQNQGIAPHNQLPMQ